MGGQTSQVGLVSWDFFVFFVFLFLISGGKNYPKKSEFSKKNLTFLQKFFWEIILICFQTFSAKILHFWSKKWLILQDFGKKNSSKMDKMGRSRPYNRFVFVFRFLLIILTKEI